MYIDFGTDRGGIKRYSNASEFHADMRDEGREWLKVGAASRNAVLIDKTNELSARLIKFSGEVSQCLANPSIDGVDNDIAKARDRCEPILVASSDGLEIRHNMIVEEVQLDSRRIAEVPALEATEIEPTIAVNAVNVSQFTPKILSFQQSVQPRNVAAENERQAAHLAKSEQKLDEVLARAEQEFGKIQNLSQESLAHQAAMSEGVKFLTSLREELKILEEKRDNEWKKTREAYEKRHSLGRNIGAWAERAENHKEKSRLILKYSMISIPVALLVIVLSSIGLFKFGGDIINAHGPEFTNHRLLFGAGGTACLIMLFAWIARMAGRAYFAETHLAADADARMVTGNIYMSLAAETDHGPEAGEALNGLCAPVMQPLSMKQ